MITDLEDRPQVNALAPVIRGANTQTQKPQRQMSNPYVSQSTQGRPSLMQALESSQNVKTVPNFVEMNKNTLKGSKVAAAHRKDYGTGKLPSLGLSKYVGSDFEDDTRNPFTVQPNTEKMLVMRELEREFRDLNKYQKDTLKVHEKMIQTRVDRSGALRRIDEIRARKPDKNQKPGRKQLQQDDADADAANKQKLNIFDAQDSTVLKHETLARIGLDDAT